VPAADEVRRLERAEINVDLMIGATGNTSELALVMWLMMTSRVRAVIFSRNRSTTTSGDAIGNGIFASTTLIPCRWLMRSSSLIRL
jgi:hypothetical protein